MMKITFSLLYWYGALPLADGFIMTSVTWTWSGAAPARPHPFQSFPPQNSATTLSQQYFYGDYDHHHHHHHHDNNDDDAADDCSSSSSSSDLAADWARRHQDDINGQTMAPFYQNTNDNNNNSNNNNNRYQRQEEMNGNTATPSSKSNSASSAEAIAELARQWAARNHDVQTTPGTPPLTLIALSSSSTSSWAYPGNPNHLSPPSTTTTKNNYNDDDHHHHWQQDLTQSWSSMSRLPPRGQQQDSQHANRAYSAPPPPPPHQGGPPSAEHPFAKYMTVSEAVQVEDPAHLQAVLDETAPIQPPPPSMEELAEAWASMTQNQDRSVASAAPGPDPFAQYMTVVDDHAPPAAFLDAEVVQDDDSDDNDNNDGSYTSFETTTITDAVTTEAETDWSSSTSTSLPPSSSSCSNSGPSMEDLAQAWASMTREDPNFHGSAGGGGGGGGMRNGYGPPTTIMGTSHAVATMAPPSPPQVQMATSGPSMEELAKAWASMTREEVRPVSAVTMTMPPPVATATAISPPPAVAKTVAPPANPLPSGGPSMQELAEAWKGMTRETKPAPTKPPLIMTEPVVPPAVGGSPSMEDLAKALASMSSVVPDPNTQFTLRFPSSSPPRSPALVPPPSPPRPAPVVHPVVDEVASAWSNFVEKHIADATANHETAFRSSPSPSVGPANILASEPEMVFETPPEESKEERLLFTEALPTDQPDMEGHNAMSNYEAFQDHAWAQAEQDSILEEMGSMIEEQARIAAEKLDSLAAKWSARNEDKEDAKLASFFKPRARQVDMDDKERVRPAFLDTLGRIFSPDPKL